MEAKRSDSSLQKRGLDPPERGWYGCDGSKAKGNKAMECGEIARVEAQCGACGLASQPKNRSQWDKKNKTI